MVQPLLSRGAFVKVVSAASLAVLVGSRAFAASARGTRLSARPGKPRQSLPPGLHSAGLATGGRDALLYLPTDFVSARPAPLLLALHGASQAAAFMTTNLASLADVTGAAHLAPDSRGNSWDAIRGEFGDDVAFIDRALAWTFDRCTIDPARVWLAGFSDGASYGISLGLANGDFMSRVLAFSPGFVIPAEHRGRPRVFVSHGRQDRVLPIERCSRIIVPELKSAGYDVRFDEFDGGHRMPPEILTAAAGWLSAR